MNKIEFPDIALIEFERLLRLDAPQLRAFGAMLNDPPLASPRRRVSSEAIRDRLGVSCEDAKSLERVGNTIAAILRRGDPPERLLEAIADLIRRAGGDRATTLLQRLDSRRDLLLESMAPLAASAIPDTRRDLTRSTTFDASTMSEEELERKLDLAFRRSVDAMNEAFDAGRLSKDKIEEAIRSYRSRHPYPF